MFVLKKNQIYIQIVLLFLVSFNGSAQIYELDKNAMAEKSIEELKKEDASISDDLARKVAEMHLQSFNNFEGYLTIQNDSIEFIMGMRNITYAKTSKDEFLKEVEYQKDTISTEKFVFVVTEDKNVQDKIKTLKEKFKQQQIKKRQEQEEENGIWEFENRRYYYDTITKGKVVKTTFKFRNTGNTNLKLSQVQTDPSTTETLWPRQEIAPGKMDSIIVEFDTGKGEIENTKKLIIVRCDKTDIPVFLDLDGVIVEE